MKLFFWKKGVEERRDAHGTPDALDRKPETGNRLPLHDRWEERILSRDPRICSKAIAEAGEKKDPRALPALIALAKSRDPAGDEAVEAIPLIILLNPGHPDIIAMVPGIEKTLDPYEPNDELWILSAICEANKGMFSGMVPQLLEMLRNYSRSGETLALKDLAMTLGNIGDKSAIGPLERLLESGCGDDELREIVSDAIEALRTKTVYVN